MTERNENWKNEGTANRISRQLNENSQHGSVVRMLDSGWWTFPDLWLTCDHFMGSVCYGLTGHKPSIPPT